MTVPRATVVCCVIAVSGGLLAGHLSAASPKERLRAKQAQAAAVLVQVNELDRRFEASVEAWNGARYELARTREELRVQRAMLRRAEQRRKVAIARVEARLVALYEQDDPTTVEILFGSTTLSQILDRLDAAHAVAQADHQLAFQATQARNRYAAAARRTARLERIRAETLTRRDVERRQIAAMLARRRRLLSSVQAEVRTLQAEEARRQARLAAEARARLERQRELLRRQAAERAAEAKAAAAEARSKAARPETTTTTDAPPPPTTTADPAPPTTTDAVTTTSDTTTTSSAPPPAATGHPEAATIALRYLGVKYVWGGATPAGFDCSGLVMYVYAQLGIQLPHYAAAQFGFGSPVQRDQLQPGDLVFFDGLDHVGIYIGGGQMVHAPQTGDVVKITPLSDFGSRYVGARRI
jgi:peptidoglycan DL-endopeptidase CwlO